MKKLRKILLWTAGTLVGLLLLLVIGFRLFFPVEKAKAYALEQATEQLGRPVAIESVNLSFSGGLGLRLGGVEVGNPEGFPGEPFLTTDNIDLMVAIGPLFKGQVRGHSLVINRPVIRARKLFDGTDNFTFAPAVDPASGQQDGTNQETAPVSATIDRIEINDGLLVFQDETTKTGARLIGLKLRSTLENPARELLRVTGTADADSLLLTAEQPVPPLAPQIEFTLQYDQGTGEIQLEELNLDVNSIALKLTGAMTGSGDDLEARGRLTADRITMEQLLALAPPEAIAELQGARLSGAIALACDLDFIASRSEPLNYAGTASVSGLVFDSPDVDATIEIKQAEADFRVDHLELRILQATAGGEPWSATVEVQDFLKPEVSGQLTGALDLALALPYLEPELEAELQGRSTFEIEFSGPVDDPDLIQISGNLGLQEVRFSANTLPEPIRRLDARVEFNRTRIKVTELTATTPSSAFAVTGTLSDPLPYFLPPELRDEAAVVPTPVLEFTMNSRRLDIDKLFPPASPGSATASSAAAGDSVLLADFPDIIGHGTVAVDTMIYSQVEFTSLTADIEIADRVIHCRNAAGKVYTGGVTGYTSVDLTNMNEPRYDGSFSAQQIEMDDFLARFTKFGGLFYGKLDLEGDFSAAGLEPSTIQESLTLDSLAGMNSGRIVTSGFAYSALNTLAKKAGQTLEKEQGLKNLSTKIRAENGSVILDQLTTGLGSLGELSLSGSYGIAGNMEFRGTLLLTEDQTRNLMDSGGLTGAVAGLLGGKKNDRLSLPLSVGGSIKNPKLSVDYSSLTEAAKENLKEDLKEDLGKKLKGFLK